MRYEHESDSSGSIISSDDEQDDDDDNARVPKETEFPTKNLLGNRWTQGDGALDKKVAKRKTETNKLNRIRHRAHEAQQHFEELQASGDNVMQMIDKNTIPRRKGKWVDHFVVSGSHARKKRRLHEEEGRQWDEKLAKENAIITQTSKDDIDYKHELHSYQLEGIHRLGFRRENVLLVQPTGSGKTRVIVGTAILLGRITVLVTPLIGVSANHAIGINQSSSSLAAVVCDTLEAADEVRLMQSISSMPSDTNEALVLVMSPAKFESRRWNEFLRAQGDRGLMRFFAVDEIHQIALDYTCREEFLKLEHALKLFLSSHRNTPIAALTATLDSNLQEKFQSLTGLHFDAKTWDTNHGKITLNLYMRNRTTPLIRKIVQECLEETNRKRSFIVR